MGAERLELSRAVQAQRILSPSRLPFRHAPYNYQFLSTAFYYIMPSKKWQGVNLNFLPLPKWVRVVGRNRDYPKTAYVAKLNLQKLAIMTILAIIAIIDRRITATSD